MPFVTVYFAHDTICAYLERLIIELLCLVYLNPTAERCAHMYDDV